MTKEKQLNALAKKILRSKDLWDLAERLAEFDYFCRYDTPEALDPLNTEEELKIRGIDICELPIFGGPEPKSTAEVWSWDADHILVGIGECSSWEIRAR